jgi:crossover junction endodeoxyribonuclease RuvC
VIVLGVDPGTTVTGYGVVERSAAAPDRLVECGVVRAAASRPLAERLDAIYQGVSDVIARHRPEAVAVESAFVHRNVRSALVLGHARGVVLLAAARAGLPLFEYAPAMVKKTVTGGGSATKLQVQRMLARLLRLAEAPRPADAADGVAVALTHCMRSGRTLRRAVVA